MADIDGIKTRPGVRVHANTVIAGIHERYSKQVAQLVQENAEISAALAATQDERDELAAKLEALAGGPSDPMPGEPGRAADAGR
jgi:hypothetical protein